MSRVLAPLPGDVDHFTIHPDGAIYVRRDGAPGSQAQLGTDPDLYAALRGHAQPADWGYKVTPCGLRGAVELRVTHGFPPLVAWSWNGADSHHEPAPDAATFALMQWLAGFVMRDARPAVTT